MPNRNPGTESATGAKPARDRLSVSLGAAEATKDQDQNQDRAAGGLLDFPDGACTSVPAAPREVRGAGSAADAAFPDTALPANALSAGGFPAGGPPKGRRESPEPLSARLRSRTGFRAAVLIGILAMALGGFFWWQAATGSPEAVPLDEVNAPAAEPPPAASAVATAAEADSVARQGTIIVHVAGAVARPGIVQLVPGSRLHEAIAAAGGGTAAADPDRLNLASVLEDGQKVLVPALGDPDPAGPAPGETAPGKTDGAGGSSPAEGRKVNLNTAGVEELGTLPRVGPVLAQRIVDWRKQHGRFKTVEELDAVEGIGPKLLEALLPLVRV